MKHQVLRPFHAALGLFVLTLGLILPTSCTKEVFNDFEDEEAVEMVLTVGADTKTENNGDRTVWTSDDVLTVIHAPAGGSEFWASPFAYEGSNAFKGKVKRLSESNDWYLVYPYSEEHTAANQIGLTFPAAQTQSGNDNKSHLAGTEFPLFGKKTGVARGGDLSLQMENLLAIAGFKVTNKAGKPVSVKQIQFTSTAPIAGGFTLDMTGSAPVVTAGSNASRTVSLTVEGGANIAANGNSMFYAAVAPTEIPAGGKLKVKVVAEDANGTQIVCYVTRTPEAATSFESGYIKTVNVDFDTTHATDPDAGSASEAEIPVGGEPEDGTYLLVYENGANSMAFAAFDEYKSQHYAIPVTVENGVVLPQEGVDLRQFAVTLENTGFEHPNDAGHDAYNVRNSEGKYVFYATAGGTYEAADALHILDSNEMVVQGTNYQYYHTFTQTTDGVRIVCSINTGGHFYLLSYTAANGFNYQQDNAAGTNLHLYQIGAKEKQNIYFEPAGTVEYDWDTLKEGTLSNAPQLKGVMSGNVTWSSSNTAVATVGSNGVVTIHKAGTAIISATAEADDTYASATASYTVHSYTSQSRKFYMTTELKAGEEYVIVSAGNALTNNNGTIAATPLTAVNNMVEVSDDALIWTSASLGNGFTLVNDGKFIQRATGNTSSGTTAEPFIGAIPETARYYIWEYDGSDKYLSTVAESGGYSAYYLYYESSKWNQSSSASTSHTVILYSATKPQNLSFIEDSIVWTIGEGYEIGGSYSFPQTVQNAQTSPVTYESSKTNVVEIDGTNLKINGVGTTKITARAPANSIYAAGEASYTLWVREQTSGGFVDLGVFNLENNKVQSFLTAAGEQYDDDYTKASIVDNYATTVPTYTESGSGWGMNSLVHAADRIDIPNPVTIRWDKISSGSTTITIYSDQGLDDIVWTQTTTGDKTSEYVYNLIPGKTYYCKVVDDSGELLRGQFATEGRRRMIRLSDRDGKYDRANNFRDLGGMVTADGTKRIKYGWIFRGTNLDGTDDAEQGIMANYLNIGWDIDLRQSTEGSNAFASKYNVNYVMCNYSADINALTSDKEKVKKTVLAFINAAKAGKASYFHCRIGSDRTGYWGLLIEGLLGISVKDCSIDYELTSFANGVTSGGRYRNSGLFKDGMNFFKNKSYYNGNLQDTITHYLIVEIGIEEEDILAFQSKVLEAL